MTIPVGETLRRLRIEKGLSQQQLADRLHMERSSVSNWEAGRRIPDAATIMQLAKALGVDAAVLFATKDEPYNVVYRSKVKDKWRLIHAFGKHIQKGEARLAIVWYVDEGEFHENDAFSGNYLNSAFSNLIQTNNAARVLQYDFLTGLPTIGHFFYLAETNFYKKAEERGENPVMLFFDLNGMRHYNAKFGFAEGDKLIRAFSRLLVETFSND